MDTDTFPQYIQIETVSLCNAICIMCPIKEWKRDTTVMSPLLFDSILYEIEKYSNNIERVTIQLDGEPLLDPDLEERIRSLKAAGIKYVAFASNGSLMSEIRAKSIISSGIDEVTFSIDGTTADTFESIRTRLSFNQCINNVTNFIKYRDQSKSALSIRIRMTIQKKNMHEFGDFLSYWKQRIGKEDFVYGKLIHSWGNWILNSSTLNDEKYKKLNSSPCPSVFNSIVILSDGRVPLCCNDFNAKYQMGNIKETSIKDIWNNIRFENMRKEHQEKGRACLRICHNCNVWDSSTKIITSDQLERLNQIN